MRTINKAGTILVKKWEGLLDGNPSTVNLDPYLDPVGIWTIGWGHAILDPSGNFLRGPAAKKKAFALYPEGITYSQADDLLRTDLLEAAKDVAFLVNKIPLTDNQFSALVSFHFNTGALKKSTLYKKLMADDFEGAAGQFGRWIKGRVRGSLVTLPGLVTRRAEEQKLFLEPEVT